MDTEKIEAKSFTKKDGFIYVYGDTNGSDVLFVFPVWMFNQMVETFFGVSVKNDPK